MTGKKIIAASRKPRQRKLEDSRTRGVFMRAIGLLLSAKDAAYVAGVDPSKVSLEKKRDDTFAEEMAKRRAVAKQTLVSKVFEAASGEFYDKAGNRLPPDWRAAAWLLERLFFEDFGKRDPDAVTAEKFAATLAEVFGGMLKFIPAEQRSDAQREFETMLAKLSSGAKDDGDDDVLEVAAVPVN
jgi:hypothetical protein